VHGNQAPELSKLSKANRIRITIYLAKREEVRNNSKRYDFAMHQKTISNFHHYEAKGEYTFTTSIDGYLYGCVGLYGRGQKRPRGKIEEGFPWQRNREKT
jgi:hypothetical protein